MYHALFELSWNVIFGIFIHKHVMSEKSKYKNVDIFTVIDKDEVVH
jgi:hypothetical protein